MKQLQRAFQRQQARNVVCAALEAHGRALERVVVFAVRLVIDDVHPPDHERAGAIDQLAATVEDPRAFGPEHPLVPVRRQIVDVHAAHVDRQHADRLDGVDVEEFVVLATEGADARQVVPLAAGVLDVRERDDARAWLGGGGENLLDGNYPPPLGVGLFRNQDQPRAARTRDFHPRVDVGRVFDAGGDDPVAPLPVQPVGDDAHPLAGVLDEGDLVFAGVDDRGGQGAKPLDVGIPGAAEVGLRCRFARMFAHCVGRGTGHRRHTRVVEKVPMPEDREFFLVADEAVEVAHWAWRGL